MGKVLSTFTPGWPGTISRSIDDIVISKPSRESTDDIAFGAPVWLTSDGKGVRNWTSGDTLAGFVGFAVRVADKTPEVYPQGANQDAGNRGVWRPGDPVDILVRGSITVKASGTPRPGAQVYVDASTGKLTSSAGSSPANLALTGVHFRGDASSTGVAEIVIAARTTI